MVILLCLSISDSGTTLVMIFQNEEMTCSELYKPCIPFLSCRSHMIHMCLGSITWNRMSVPSYKATTWKRFKFPILVNLICRNHGETRPGKIVLFELQSCLMEFLAFADEPCASFGNVCQCSLHH